MNYGNGTQAVSKIIYGEAMSQKKIAVQESPKQEWQREKRLNRNISIVKWTFKWTFRIILYASYFIGCGWLFLWLLEPLDTIKDTDIRKGFYTLIAGVVSLSLFIGFAWLLEQLFKIWLKKATGTNSRSGSFLD